MVFTVVHQKDDNVWLELDEISSAGIIRLLWEGSEPYSEGNALEQDSLHDGEYNSKIFCFGFWLNKDDSLIYDGKLLYYAN